MRQAEVRDGIVVGGGTQRVASHLDGPNIASVKAVRRGVLIDSNALGFGKADRIIYGANPTIYLVHTFSSSHDLGNNAFPVPVARIVVLEAEIWDEEHEILQASCKVPIKVEQGRHDDPG